MIQRGDAVRFIGKFHGLCKDRNDTSFSQSLVFNDVFIVLAINSAKESCLQDKSALAIEILTKHGYMVPDNHVKFQLLLDKPNNTL